MKASKLLVSFFTLMSLVCLMSVSVFAGESVNVNDRATLKAALEDANVESITLTDNISLSGENWHPVVISSGRTLVIDGNNKTISNMVVRDYLTMSNGSDDPTSGHAADYLAGFIGDNHGNLTISNLKFSNADVNMNPLSSESSGSSQLGIVCGHNTGALVMNNVEVSDSVVKGYNKLGTLLGHLASGSFVANKCIINNTKVILEADGYDTEASYAGLILGANQSKTAKVNGIKIVNSICEKDASVIWPNHEEKIAPESKATYIQYTESFVYGLICQTYKKDEHKIEAVKFEAAIGDYSYETLEDAVIAAVSGDVVKLIDTVSLETAIEYDYKKAIALDLNGNTLNLIGDAALNVNDGEVTLRNSKSTGSIEAEGSALRATALTDGMVGKLIIESGVKVNAEGCCVIIKGLDATLITNGDLNSTGWFAISGNGNPENKGVKVFINGGTVTSSAEKTAVYFPNQTTLEITGGTITGGTAVYQKSGNLTISGGTFIANGEKAPFVHTGNGCNTTGETIIIEACDYPGGNPTTSITGGKFSSVNNNVIGSYIYDDGKEETPIPARIMGFVTGGHFTSNPTEFLAEGKVAVASTETGYSYTVADKNAEIEVETELEVAEPVVDNQAGIEISGDFEVDAEVLEVVASTLVNDPEVIDSEAAVSAVETLPDYVSGETVVTVVVQPYMDVKITEFESGDVKTITVDITPMYNLVATIASGDEDIELEGTDKNAEVIGGGKLSVTEPIVMRIPLPEGFATGVTEVYVHHKGYIYTAQVIGTASGDVAEFTNPHGFSVFEVKNNFEGVAQNTETNDIYSSLKAAIDEAANNDTIILLAGNAEVVEVNRVVTFVFNANGNEFSGDIKAGSNVVLEKTENATNGAVTYKFTRRQTGGGGGGVTTYTVKFETNGGTAIEKVKVNPKAKVEKPSNPTKEGYTFEGWYTDVECTNAYDFNSEVKKSFTLYAKWTENVSEWENPFDDVEESHWFYDAVRYANEEGLFNGMSATEFGPDVSMTRAMLVTVLYRLVGEPEVTGESKFLDVVKGSYYEKAVMWAEANGIVNGMSATEFAPDNQITREQIVTIMFRFVNYKGIDTSVGEDTNILSYNDASEVSEYAIPAMQWAVGSGVMKGKTETTLNPKVTATRAEVATILQRFIESNK